MTPPDLRILYQPPRFLKVSRPQDLMAGLDPMILLHPLASLCGLELTTQQKDDLGFLVKCWVCTTILNCRFVPLHITVYRLLRMELGLAYDIFCPLTELYPQPILSTFFCGPNRLSKLKNLSGLGVMAQAFHLRRSGWIPVSTEASRST